MCRPAAQAADIERRSWPSGWPGPQVIKPTYKRRHGCCVCQKPNWRAACSRMRRIGLPISSSPCGGNGSWGATLHSFLPLDRLAAICTVGQSSRRPRSVPSRSSRLLQFDRGRPAPRSQLPGALQPPRAQQRRLGVGDLTQPGPIHRQQPCRGAAPATTGTSPSSAPRGGCTKLVRGPWAGHGAAGSAGACGAACAALAACRCVPAHTPACAPASLRAAVLARCASTPRAAWPSLPAY